MNFDNSFPRRVALARNSLGMTQAELAKKVGVVHRQIAAYEGGEAKPRDKVLNNLAAVLGTSSDWLKCGIGDGPSISNMRKTVTVREIPLLSWIQAISITDDDSTLDGSISDFIPAPIGAGERSFAITILGNSMDAPSGLSFPDGMVVCFDPDVSPKDGDFVLCALENYEATFKQLIFDQGKMFLQPLNDFFMNIEVGEDCKIIAVAIHSQIDLRSIRHSKRHSKHSEWAAVEQWDEHVPITPFNESETLSKRISEIENKLDKILISLKK